MILDNFIIDEVMDVMDDVGDEIVIDTDIDDDIESDSEIMNGTADNDDEIIDQVEIGCCDESHEEDDYDNEDDEEDDDEYEDDEEYEESMIVDALEDEELGIHNESFDIDTYINKEMERNKQ